MIKIEKTSNHNQLRLIADKTIFEFLQNHFTVKDKNCYFSPLYRAKRWDGKIRFLRKDGIILSGLLVEVLRIAKINQWSIAVVFNPFVLQQYSASECTIRH